MKSISEKKIKNRFRKKRYYNAHPNEALEDHLKQIEMGSDDFIMEKVKKWEMEQGL